ncbi:EscS/YscS/HrcS family type III secretion system export apparatus protein [Vibrio splendidus]|uniref:EscS/YscS/HrcS family type III secretion system export apparatus protein n=1 Tax=Vibrio lentus TaxID=136468 RepID=A0A2J6UH23_9VIBR|nr:type III secretion system export apparatus subunit SctS [Vibrio lentus]PHN83503.1 EscS/YscS/HrcS family type III secretion system export apparatus protein [Vibrio splendidus]MCB5361995.1 EscS/YscS/HrcS family type III secretion system export apparatus protein [Vibrio lentus]MCB5452330.1 EscS/YscS/HrcS family type III secretion system export apparatus protein [Vibrio lentus]MCB5464362.1 EscS/YscS/HrcS family type III secretion system export apparatus protein [Vibrio lentus]MCB5464539.1 EscS/
MFDILTLFAQSLWLVVVLSLPPLLVAAGVGVFVSLIQALMQLQDQTLPFVIKLVAVGLTMVMTGRWMTVEVIKLTNLIFQAIAMGW